MNKILLIIFIILFSSIYPVLAQPFNQQVQSNLNTGISVQVATEKTITQNQALDINVHIFNISTGLILTNSSTSCEINVYNFSGSSKLDKLMDYNSEQDLFNFTINSSVFSDFTFYPFVVHCNTSSVGGFSSGSFLVTAIGNPIIKANDTIIFGMIIFIPLFISFILLIISWLLPKESYWALKYGLILLSFIFIFQAYQYGVVSIAKFYNFTELIDAIGDNTFIYTMIFWIVIFIFMFTLIYDLFMIFRKKHKTGDYEE